MGGYILTFIAAMIKGIMAYFLEGSVTTEASEFGASLLNGVAVILIIVGFAVSFFKSKGIKAKMISLLINAAVLLFGTLLVKAFVPVAIVIGIAAFVIIRFKIKLPFLGNGNGEAAGNRLPDLIFDENNTQYSKISENEAFAQFRNDETGAEVTIYIPATGITGNSINSSSGNFYW